MGVDKQGASIRSALGAGQGGREGRSPHPAARPNHGDGGATRSRVLRGARGRNAREQLLNLGGNDKGALRVTG